jgi:outer membrane protein W
VEQPSYTFTGPVYRRLSSFTALATAHYYLTQSAVQPFIGVGIGGGWFTARQQIVDRDVTTYTSGLAVAPEVGFLFSVAPRLGLVLSARYQYNLTTFGAVRNPSWVSAQAGVAYCF